jgi:hypothetical protein
VELTLLTIPGCPNAAVFGEGLAIALAGHPSAVLLRREVAGEREAAEAGMHGSPTLLIGGVDPFAGPGQTPACRAGCTAARPGRGAAWPCCSAPVVRDEEARARCG